MTNLSIQRGLDIIESIMDKQQAMNEKQVKEIEQLTTERDRLKASNKELLEACGWASRAEHHTACIRHNPKRGDVNACDCYIGTVKTAIAKAER